MARRRVESVAEGRAIGRRSPGQSQGHVRTTRLRNEQMQSKVARLIRKSGGAQFEETELEEDLLENLRQRSFSEARSSPEQHVSSRKRTRR